MKINVLIKLRDGLDVVYLNSSKLLKLVPPQKLKKIDQDVLELLPIEASVSSKISIAKIDFLKGL